MAITTLKNVDVAANVKCQLGEGPVWNDELNSLHFVDIFAKHIHTLNLDSMALKTFELQQNPGAVIPTMQSNLLIPMNDGLYVSDYDGVKISKYLDLENSLTNNRMNDAKCDNKGRLFVGSMSDGVIASGSLYIIDGHEIRRIRERVIVSNGLAWSPDNKLIYYIDSGLQAVLVSSFFPDSQGNFDFKVFLDFPQSYGIPDGMCSDSEGGLWVAFFGGSVIRRYSANGSHTHTIEMPVEQITSCAYQDNSSIMYITTASIDVDENQIRNGAGKVFRLDTGIQGLPTNKFLLH